MDHRSKAVGRAARVGNNVVIARFVFLVVYTHHDSDVFTFGWRGDNHFLRTSFNVAVSLFSFGEETGGLDNDIDSQRFPRECFGAFLQRQTLDAVAVHDKNVVFVYVR